MDVSAFGNEFNLLVHELSERESNTMPRLRPRVITAVDAERIRTRTANIENAPPPPEAKEDSYLAKLIKYIPAEAIATHQAVAGFQSQYPNLVGWLTAILLPFSLVWFFFTTKDKGEEPSWSQIILCPVAFLIWMIVVKSPAILKFYGETSLNDAGSSLLLIFATAIMPATGRLIDEIVKRFK